MTHVPILNAIRTQQECAEILGVKKSTIRFIERTALFKIKLGIMRELREHLSSEEVESFIKRCGDGYNMIQETYKPSKNRRKV